MVKKIPEFLEGRSPDSQNRILENTKIINNFDLKINEINILQEYAKLYFKIKE